MNETDLRPVVEDAAEHTPVSKSASDVGAQVHHENSEARDHVDQIRADIAEAAESNIHAGVDPSTQHGQFEEAKLPSKMDRLKGFFKRRYSEDVASEHNLRRTEMQVHNQNNQTDGSQREEK